MMKIILKWFIPSADTVSGMVVDQVADAVNGSDKTDVIVKYASMFDRWQDVQSRLVRIIKDGKIDDAEKKELKESIKPIIERILQEITK